MSPKAAAKGSEASDRTLYLIDGHSQVFKAYHAIRQLSTSKGIPTNAVYGFLQILHKLLRTRNPHHLAVVFDAGAKTFRHEMYAEYKANRAAPPDDLTQQMTYILQILEGLRIPILRKPGFEADDLIATLCTGAVREGFDVVIVTADKDLFQLVSDKVKVLRLEPDKETMFDRDGVKEKMGVFPEQVGDYLAIVGDSSDNVPGIRGIGPKGAITLLDKYGDLRSVLDAAGDLKGKQSEYVAGGRESALLSRELVSLRYDVELDDLPSDFRRRTPDIASLQPIYRELEFRRFFEEIQTSPAERDTTYRAITDEESLAEFCELIRDGSEVAIDTETDSLIPITTPLSGISLSCTPGEGVYIPIGHTDELGKPLEPQLSIEQVRKHLAPIFADPLVRKVFHNSKFDWKVLKRFGLDISGVQFDTLLASYILNPDRRAHGLKDLAADLLGIKQTRIEELIGSGKKQIPFGQVDIQKATEYSSADADITIQLYRMLNPRLDDEGPLPNIAVGEPRAGSVGDSDQVLAEPGTESPGEGEQFDLFEMNSLSARSEPSPVAPPSARPTPPAPPPPPGGTARMRELYEKVELPLVPVLMEMETVGVRIDPAVFKDLANDMEARLEDLSKRIYECCGHEFNLGSPKQVAQVLFEELKLKPGKSKKTQFSTDVQVLEELSQFHEAPRLLAEYRQFEKLKSTYVDVLPTLVLPETGRIHTSYNQAVAATGRLSSSDPNLQNIPIRTAEGRKIRRGFIPRDGDHVFVAADYSQIELRVLAHVTRDPLFVEAYRAGTDIHRLTASKIYRIDPEAVNDDQRGVGKTVNFATIYGIGAPALATKLKITTAEGRSFIDEYFKAYSGVRAWLDYTLESARHCGYVETVSGRRRYLPDINSRNFNARMAAERIAMNAPIQGTSADMIKMAMIQIHEHIQREKMRARMLLQVHDELIFEVPKDEVDEIKTLAKSLMESALPLEVPVHVDIAVGNNWGEC